MRIEDEQYRQLARNLKTIDRKIAAGIRRGLRQVGAPLGEKVQEQGAEDIYPGEMRGGAEEWFRRKATPRVTIGAGGLFIVFGRKGAAYPGPVDRGILRHPVPRRGPEAFGPQRARVWRDTKVPGGSYSKAFKDNAEAEAPTIAQYVLNAIEGGI